MDDDDYSVTIDAAYIADDMDVVEAQPPQEESQEETDIQFE
jgi:hypothetical protein